MKVAIPLVSLTMEWSSARFPCGKSIFSFSISSAWLPCGSHLWTGDGRCDPGHRRFVQAVEVSSDDDNWSPNVPLKTQLLEVDEASPTTVQVDADTSHLMKSD